MRNFYSRQGISVNVSSPLWLSDRYAPVTFQHELTSYGHEIAVDGGFLSASIGVRTKQINIDEWIENGLGRDVAVYDSAGVVWNGFVNNISANIGTLSVSRGPMMNIGNRVEVMYSRIEDSGEPPEGGGTFETPIVESLASQAKYGIIEKIMSVGQCTLAEAYLIRDTFLNDIKNPETTQGLSFSPGEVSLTLECLGYSEWLNAYIYNNVSTTYITLDVKIKAILTADPNGIFNTDQTNIDYNGAITQYLEDKNRFAGTIIKSMVAMGDGSDNRWMFGVYEDRKAYYNSIATTVDHSHRLYEGKPAVYGAGGASIKPWRVRPGVWVKVTDFLIGRQESSVIREDPRNVFIESVRYTAPYGLDITGSRAGKLGQLLAKMGLGGA